MSSSDNSTSGVPLREDSTRPETSYRSPSFGTTSRSGFPPRGDSAWRSTSYQSPPFGTTSPFGFPTRGDSSRLATLNKFDPTETTSPSGTPLMSQSRHQIDEKEKIRVLALEKKNARLEEELTQLRNSLTNSLTQSDDREAAFEIRLQSKEAEIQDLKTTNRQIFVALENTGQFGTSTDFLKAAGSEHELTVPQDSYRENFELREKETKIKDMHAELKDKEAKINYMEAELKDKEAKVQDMDAELKDKEAKINDMEYSIEQLTMAIERTDQPITADDSQKITELQSFNNALLKKFQEVIAVAENSARHQMPRAERLSSVADELATHITKVKNRAQRLATTAENAASSHDSPAPQLEQEANTATSEVSFLVSLHETLAQQVEEDNGYATKVKKASTQARRKFGKYMSNLGPVLPTKKAEVLPSRSTDTAGGVPVEKAPQEDAPKGNAPQGGASKLNALRGSAPQGNASQEGAPQGGAPQGDTRGRGDTQSQGDTRGRGYNGGQGYQQGHDSRGGLQGGKPYRGNGKQHDDKSKVTRQQKPASQAPLTSIAPTEGTKKPPVKDHEGFITATGGKSAPATLARVQQSVEERLGSGNRFAALSNSPPTSTSAFSAKEPTASQESPLGQISFKSDAEKQGDKADSASQPTKAPNSSKTAETKKSPVHSKAVEPVKDPARPQDQVSATKTLLPSDAKTLTQPMSSLNAATTAFVPGAPKSMAQVAAQAPLPSLLFRLSEMKLKREEEERLKASSKVPDSEKIAEEAPGEVAEPFTVDKSMSFDEIDKILGNKRKAKRL